MHYAYKAFVLIALIYQSTYSITLDQAYFQLAQTLKESNESSEAILYLQKAIACNPEHAPALFQLGMHYYQQGQIDQAYNYLERVCKLDSLNLQAFLHAGICAITLQHIDSAISYYQHAQTLNPSSPKAHFLLGHAYVKKQNLHAAIKEFNITLQLSPNSADTLLYLANALRDSQQLDACLDHYEKALVLDPSNQQTLFEKAQALVMYGDFPQAYALYQDLYKKNASSHVLMYNLAHLHKKMHQYDCAIELYQKILHESPDFYQARLALAQAYLPNHDYFNGFKALALSTKNHMPETPLLTQLSDAQDKTILITASWNHEDMIQFLIFVPILKQKGARVLVQADRHIAPLLELCPYIDLVITPEKTQIPYFDMHISILALPSLCIDTHNMLPPFKPYLAIPSKSMNAWHSKIHSDTTISIGIYWKSDESSYTKAEDKNIPLSTFNELMQLAKIHCYALQQPSQEECNQLNERSIITLFGKNICPEKEILEFCSVISALDIVITCDSLTAHLAGALGKPVILIIPEIAQWRWIHQEHQSCFYPSIHIIQLCKNNYADVTTQIMGYIGKYSSTYNYGNIE